MRLAVRVPGGLAAAGGARRGRAARARRDGAPRRRRRAGDRRAARDRRRGPRARPPTRRRRGCRGSHPRPGRCCSTPAPARSAPAAAIAALTRLAGDALRLARVEAIEPAAGGVRLRTSAGEVRCTRCLVCAGGGHGAPRRPARDRDRPRAARRLPADVPGDARPRPARAGLERSQRPLRRARVRDARGRRTATPSASSRRCPSSTPPDAEAVPAAAVDVSAARRRLVAYVRAAFPGLDPEPVDGVLRLIAPLRGPDEDAIGLWARDGVLAFAGHNLFKHAPRPRRPARRRRARRRPRSRAQAAGVDGPGGVAHGDRHPHERAQAAVVVGDLDLPHPGRPAAVAAARLGVDRALGDRAQEARLVRQALGDPPLGDHGERGRERGDRLGDRREHAAVHEAHRLLDLVAHRDARADALVVGLEDLQAVEGVEGLVQRNDGLEAHEERHDSARRPVPCGAG